MDKSIMISGFADEIASPLEKQIEVLKKLGVCYIEMRGVNGKSLVEHSLDEVREIKKQLDANGIKISSVGSPIGKIMITDDFEDHFQLYKKTVEIAKILETPNIRMFSFYIPQDEEPEKQPEPEPQDVRPASETETRPEKDAVDVSASIISNFAKMFTREKAAEPDIQTEIPAEPVNELGNANRTIEDVVASVIRRIIGDEVSRNWRKGADYDKLAREEIAAQTRQWLDKNLPALVERIVKQEIERVMAKVGDDR